MSDMPLENVKLMYRQDSVRLIPRERLLRCGIDILFLGLLRCRREEASNEGCESKFIGKNCVS